MIEFILNTSVEEKALVLATAFLIDLMYFENSGWFRRQILFTYIPIIELLNSQKVWTTVITFWKIMSECHSYVDKNYRISFLSNISVWSIIAHAFKKIDKWYLALNMKYNYAYLFALIIITQCCSKIQNFIGIPIYNWYSKSINYQSIEIMILFMSM